MRERVFTLAEANALVPMLSLYFERIGRARELATFAVQRLGTQEKVESALTGTGGLSAREADEGHELRAALREIQSCVVAINEMGCLVKGIDQGLVDFLAEREGRLVYLCWQYGEYAVSYWHDLDSGFSGRKPLEAPQRPVMVQ